MERTDTASRVIWAPITRVFAALVDPKALAEWLPPVYVAEPQVRPALRTGYQWILHGTTATSKK